ncbi:MAG: phosphonate C-P lyase system protein PhnG [Phototrophicaceae bacterium]
MSAYTRSEALSILTKATPDALKELADTALTHLDEIEIIKNRTGLVMLPYTDSAEGTAFHLGEVLVAEAHILVSREVEGYGMVIGRDLVQAMAVAVLDACIALDIMMGDIYTFLDEQNHLQIEADTLILKQVQATRVEMETL